MLLSEKDKDEVNTDVKKLNEFTYFIEIQRSANKKIKIPCSSEAVARRILASYSNNKSNSKISFV